MTLAHEAPVSQPLFSYYWLSAPEHPYDVCNVPYYHERWLDSKNIHSIDQLYWGLYRFYVDALLYFGSIRTAYQRLRQLSEEDLHSYFAGQRFDGLSDRGDSLPLSQIAKDKRYLISEMACKSYDVLDTSGDANQIQQVMMDLLEEHRTRGGGPITARQLLIGDYAKEQYSHLQPYWIIGLERLFGNERGVGPRWRGWGPPESGVTSTESVEAPGGGEPYAYL